MWRDDVSLDGIVAVGPDDKDFIAGLHEYIVNYQLVRQSDKEKYIEDHREGAERYWWRPRWFGLMPPRGVVNKPFTTEEIDTYIFSLDSWFFGWRRYEELYNARISKAQNLLKALERGNDVFVDNSYYDLILSPKRKTYIASGKWHYFL